MRAESYGAELELRCAAARLPVDLRQAWARECAGWFGPGRTPLASAPHMEHLAVRETPLGRVVAKRGRERGLKLPLVALGARPRRAVRAFRLAEALLARGFATPEPLAVLVQDAWAVLVTRHVDGQHPWEFLQGGGSIELLLATLGRELARLHAAGFRHRDLKASNLLLVRRGAELEVVWTDLDGLRHVGRVRRATRARDLARLAMSFESAPARAAGVRADHWPRLAAAYLAAALGRPPSTDELGALLERTRAWSARAIRRHLARGAAVR